MMKRLLQVLCCLLVVLPLHAAQVLSVSQYIPPKAIQYIPVVESETKTYFSSMPMPGFFEAMIEHETCISLTHRYCWNPQAKLDTAREFGGGLGQTTIAYRKNGTVRFDTITELKRRYPDPLKEFSWKTIFSRPDLQIRSVVLLNKSNYRWYETVPYPLERMKFVAGAYNGGAGDINKSRRVCGLTKGCDPNVWERNVEKHCVKSRAKLYGNRSACDINVAYPTDVVGVRMPKYRRYRQDHGM